MEEELIPLVSRILELVGIYAIIIALWMIAKYVDIVVTYFKDMKIAKMTMKRPEDMENIIVSLVTPESTKTSLFSNLKKKLGERKKAKEYGLKYDKLQK